MRVTHCSPAPRTGYFHEHDPKPTVGFLFVLKGIPHTSQGPPNGNDLGAQPDDKTCLKAACHVSIPARLPTGGVTFGMLLTHSVLRINMGVTVNS